MNHAECYPIVIYFKVSNRNLVKQIRNEYGKFYQKSSRRLFENAENLEYFYSYLFTSIINVDSIKNWYETLKSQIEFQQEESVWMSNDRFIEKDLLNSDEYFTSTRLSDSDEYSLQEKSNLDLYALNNKEKNCLQRVLSDPMMFRKHKFLKSYSSDLPHHLSNDEEEDDSSTCLKTSAISLPNHNHVLIEPSSIDHEKEQHQSDLLYSNNPCVNQRLYSITKTNGTSTNNNKNDSLFQKERFNTVILIL